MNERLEILAIQKGLGVKRVRDMDFTTTQRSLGGVLAGARSAAFWWLMDYNRHKNIKTVMNKVVRDMNASDSVRHRGGWTNAQQDPLPINELFVR